MRWSRTTSRGSWTTRLASAREAHVEKMRQLLLDCGADKSNDDRERRVTCQRAWLSDTMCIRDSWDLTDYDPTGSAMESQW